VDHRSFLGGEYNVLHMAVGAGNSSFLVEYIVQKFPDLIFEKIGSGVNHAEVS
jgi:hypothetical protein